MQDVVADAGGRAILFPGATVPADGDTRFGPPFDDRAMASSDVIGPISRDRADLFIFGELRQQIWQHRAIALPAGGEFDGPNITGLRIDLSPAPSFSLR